jgi:hypothetical protein
VIEALSRVLSNFFIAGDGCLFTLRRKYDAVMGFIDSLYSSVRILLLIIHGTDCTWYCKKII